MCASKSTSTTRLSRFNLIKGFSKFLRDFALTRLDADSLASSAVPLGWDLEDFVSLNDICKTDNIDRAMAKDKTIKAVLHLVPDKSPELREEICQFLQSRRSGTYSEKVRSSKHISIVVAPQGPTFQQITMPMKAQPAEI